MLAKSENAKQQNHFRFGEDLKTRGKSRNYRIVIVFQNLRLENVLRRPALERKAVVLKFLGQVEERFQNVPFSVAAWCGQ